MSTHKYFDRICVAVLIVTLLITVLFMNGERLGIQVIVDADSEAHSDDSLFTENDLDGAWDTSGASVITLSGASASISGSGAYVNGSDVVIASPGKYVISGSLEEGSVIVDAYDSSKVWIMLDGVDITCSDDACFQIDQADKVFLTLAEGSVNTMTSGSEYSAEALADGTGGVIFAHDDLTINGSGSLVLTGGYKHGIDANDDLVITGGEISVTVPSDGFHVNDSFRLTGASVAISAGDDGIHSDTSIAVAGGSLLISECYEGLEALTVDISGGEIVIYPSDDGINANGGSGMGMMGFGGMHGASQQADQTKAAGSSGTDQTETWLHISGGDLTIINESGRDADGLDSNGDILITGGNIRVSMVNSGSNCAIDYASENGGVCEITGGTVIACGSYSMAEGFSETSSQCSVLYIISEGEDAGETVGIEDSDGSMLISWEVPCSFSAVTISCPEMEQGGTYKLVIGDREEEITIEETSVSYGNAQSSMFGGKMNWGGMTQRPQDSQDGQTSDQSSGWTNGHGGMGGKHGQRPGSSAQSGTDSSADSSAQQTEGQSSEENSSQEQPPGPPKGMEMPADGEAPEPPSDGEMLESSEDGSRPRGGQMPFADRSEASENSDAAVDTRTALDGQSWIYIAASAAVLAAAIFIAAVFKKN